jgi:hypothetical protein
MNLEDIVAGIGGMILIFLVAFCLGKVPSNHKRGDGPSIPYGHW